MTIDRQTLLQRLEGEQGDAVVARIVGYLEREDTRIVSDRTSKVSVSEALRLWRTRLLNTDITGQTLHGIESLLSRLQTFAPQRKLEQVAFIGSETAANLFFERTSHSFVGAVLVDTGGKGNPSML
jgi:hypothetical protein